MAIITIRCIGWDFLFAEHMKRLLLWSLLIQYLNSLRFVCCCCCCFIFISNSLLLCVPVPFSLRSFIHSFLCFYERHKHKCSMFETNNAIIGLSKVAKRLVNCVWNEIKFRYRYVWLRAHLIFLPCYMPSFMVGDDVWRIKSLFVNLSLSPSLSLNVSIKQRWKKEKPFLFFRESITRSACFSLALVWPGIWREEIALIWLSN